MNRPGAFIFDLNGTIIDDMDYHIGAWYHILNELGAGISYEKTRLECYGKNHELLERIFPGRFTEQEKEHMSFEKEKSYQEKYRPVMKEVDGLRRFLEEAREEQVVMGIGSAAIGFNIDFILDGLEIRNYFKAIVGADEVSRSKPDPETFLECAIRLETEPRNCIVFEDSPKGVEAATRAGMKTVVLTTMHGKEDFESAGNILLFSPDFNGLSAGELIKK